MQEPVTRREREVWQACDTLWQQGEKLTGDALREQLASLGYARGSFNEIYKYRKTWTRSRGQDVRFLSAKSTTQLPDSLSRAVAALREELQVEAGATIQQVEAKAEEAFQEVSQRLEVTEQQLTRLQTDYTSKQQEVTALKVQLIELQQRWEAECLQRSQAQGELQVLREQTTQLNQTLAQQLSAFEQLTQQQELQHQQAQLALQTLLKEEKQHTQLATQTLNAEKSNLEKKLQKAASNEQRLHEQFTDLKHQLKHVQAETTHLKAEHRTLIHDNQQQGKVIITLQTELQYLKELEAKLKNQLKAKEKIFTASQVKVGLLEEKWQQAKQAVKTKE